MEKKANSVKKAFRALAFGGLCTLLSGCGEQPTMEMKVEPIMDKGIEKTGYSVIRVGVFEDNLAYGGKRGVYEIIDHKTGKKYIGVSGVGISELGAHSSGKTTVSDER